MFFLQTNYLKSLAFEMESEAKDHHRLLNSLDDDFDSAGGFLGGTMNRVRHMMNSGRGNRQLMCYVSLGLVGAFFFLYFVLRRVSSGGAAEMEP